MAEVHLRSTAWLNTAQKKFGGAMTQLNSGSLLRGLSRRITGSRLRMRCPKQGAGVSPPRTAWEDHEVTQSSLLGTSVCPSESSVGHKESSVKDIVASWAVADMQDPEAIVFCSAGVGPRVVSLVSKMERSGFPVNEIVEMLVHAEAYCEEHRALVSSMGPLERVHAVFVLLLLAHWHVSDEPCTMANWHETFFGDYCQLRDLEAAVMKFLALRGFKLRVDDNVLRALRLRLCFR
mmetsp:Transcript_38041/g.91250  ORF Transcript_38041/g.91250 Transcript_38041/m.91250 type:complete len:235 (+) Transcript_38041:44-748(+)